MLVCDLKTFDFILKNRYSGKWQKLFDVEKGQLVNKLGFDNQVRFKIVNASCVRDLHKSDTN